MEGMSERQYAAHVGLSRGAIQKAKAAGRLVLHADGSIDAAQVLAAIDRGVAYLKREQLPRGRWNEMTGYDGGVTALCTLALLNAPRWQQTMLKACGVRYEDYALKARRGRTRARSGSSWPNPPPGLHSSPHPFPAAKQPPPEEACTARGRCTIVLVH